MCIRDRLRGLPKIHKNNMPVRLLVNFTSAPSYKIAKKIDKIVRPVSYTHLDVYKRQILSSYS